MSVVPRQGSKDSKGELIKGELINWRCTDCCSKAESTDKKKVKIPDFFCKEISNIRFGPGFYRGWSDYYRQGLGWPQGQTRCTRFHP